MADRHDSAIEEEDRFWRDFFFKFGRDNEAQRSLELAASYDPTSCPGCGGPTVLDECSDPECEMNRPLDVGRSFVKKWSVL